MPSEGLQTIKRSNFHEKKTCSWEPKCKVMVKKNWATNWATMFFSIFSHSIGCSVCIIISIVFFTPSIPSKDSKPVHLVSRTSKPISASRLRSLSPVYGSQVFLHFHTADLIYLNVEQQPFLKAR